MNLDQMKEKWQDSKLFDKVVEDVVTKKILESKNHTCLDEMKKDGRKSLYISFSLLILSLPALVFLTKNDVSLYFFIVYGVIGLLLCIYSCYMQKQLEMVDFSIMSIKKASEQTLLYRKHLILFAVAGGFVVLIFVVTFLYFYLRNQTSNGETGFLFFLKPALMVLVVFIISRYSLWKNYYKKISEIQHDLIELKSLS